MKNLKILNNKNSIRIIFISIIILMMLFSGIGFSYATTSQELKDQQADIDNKIKETETEIAGKKSQMTEHLNQITKLNSQISTYETEISSLEEQIENLNSQIAEKESNLVEEEKKYNEQKELLEKRLIAMYESGESSYLDMLLSSDGLTEFISNYFLISEIANYDEELLNKIQATKNQIQAEKDYIESAKNEIQENKTSAENKKQSLSSSKSQKQAIVSTLSAEESVLQDQLEEFEADKKEIQKQLAAIAAKNKTTTVTVAPSAAGYGTPLAGKTKANITTGYMGYSGHTGVDFSTAAGTPILAVKSGTVVISKALKRANGTYRSYGEYIVIDHHDGTMTLYAHMSARYVSEGTTVSQGQQIGAVGSTGNSTGNHLHFEVRIGGSPVNPTPYLP